MATPAVSIGLPVYNGAEYLAAAIESILAQEFSDFELIISDNGSTDATPEICRRFAAADTRVRVHRVEANRGLVWNFNRVFELARGEFFKWSAHDDLCHPPMLRRCMEVWREAPAAVALVYPQSYMVDGAGAVLRVFDSTLATEAPEPWRRLGFVLERLSYVNPIYGVFRSSVLARTRLHESFQGSDYVLLAEVAMLGGIREIPEVLFSRRLHEKNTMKMYTTPQQVAALYDPAKAGRRQWLTVHQRLFLEYLRSVWRMPLSPGARLRCAGAVCRHHGWLRTKRLLAAKRRNLARRLGLRPRAAVPPAG